MIGIARKIADGTLAGFLYWLSIHFNAVGVFASGSFDGGDTGTPRYGNWGDGRRDAFGLMACHYWRNHDDLWRQFPYSIGHNMRSFCFNYMQDYVKRGTRVSCLAFVVLEIVAVVGWLR